MLALLYALCLLAVVQAGALLNCRGSCFTDAIVSTGCSSKDTHCICTSPSLMATLTQCMENGCNEEESAAIVSYTQSFCNDVINVQKRGSENWPLGNHHWWQQSTSTTTQTATKTTNGSRHSSSEYSRHTYSTALTKSSTQTTNQGHHRPTTQPTTASSQSYPWWHAPKPTVF